MHEVLAALALHRIFNDPHAGNHQVSPAQREDAFYARHGRRPFGHGIAEKLSSLIGRLTRRIFGSLERFQRSRLAAAGKTPGTVSAAGITDPPDFPET